MTQSQTDHINYKEEVGSLSGYYGKTVKGRNDSFSAINSQLCVLRLFTKPETECYYKHVLLIVKY